MTNIYIFKNTNDAFNVILATDIKQQNQKYTSNNVRLVRKGSVLQQQGIIFLKSLDIPGEYSSTR